MTNPNKTQQTLLAYNRYWTGRGSIEVFVVLMARIELQAAQFFFVKRDRTANGALNGRAIHM